MSKPVLYGSMLSAPTRSILLTAKAIDIELEFKETNLLMEFKHLLKGEKLSEEFIRINYVIPILIDEGNTISESAAINAYLVDKFALDDSLYPKGQRDVVDERMCSNDLTSAGFAIVLNVIKGSQRKVTDKKKEAVIKCYSKLELFLENGDFLVENNLTIADFTCITQLSTMKELVPIDNKRFSKLVAYIDRMTKLTYYDLVNTASSDMYVSIVKKAMNDNIQKSSCCCL